MGHAKPKLNLKLEAFLILYFFEFPYVNKTPQCPGEGWHGPQEDYSVFSSVKTFTHILLRNHSFTSMEMEGRRQNQGLDAIRYKLY